MSAGANCDRRRRAPKIWLWLIGFEPAVATSSVNEVATVFLFGACLASSLVFSDRSIVIREQTATKSSARFHIEVKRRQPGMRFVSRLGFVEVEAAPAACCCGFIGLGSPRRQTEHRAVYSPTKTNLRRRLSPAGSWGSLYFSSRDKFSAPGWE
jgi:hypothetical protein